MKEVNNIITAIDIGTSSIKGLSAVIEPKTNEVETTAYVEEPAFGVRRGVVAKPEEVSRIISKVVEQLQMRTGANLEGAFININGSHLFTSSSWGSVVVSRADQSISQEDVERVIEAAKTFSLPSNKEIFESYPKEFIVDGERGIKEPPVGMKGLKLEAEVLLLGAFSPYLKNCEEAVWKANLDIEDIIPSPLAAAKAVLDDKLRELGTIVVDIGAGTTGVAVYKEGCLIHLVVFPVGSAHITNDIAIGLKTDTETAEKIKKEFGSCVVSSKKKERIKLENGEELPFYQREVVKIIVPRVSEIFSTIQKNLKENFPKESFPGGVVLTGGGSKLAKIVELGKKEFKLPCRLGIPKSIKGLERDPSLSVAVGLLLSGIENQDNEVVEKSGFVSNLLAKIKRFFSSLNP